MKRVISLGVGLSMIMAIMWPALLPRPLLAQANLPLPLPDLILYGMVKQGSSPVTEGTVTVQLPRGGEVTAAIEPVAGTPYTYKVAVPLAMYLAERTTYAPDSVRPGAGEAIRFAINGHPAMLRGSNGAMTDQLEIAADAAGRKLLVDLSLATAEQSPVGDVNANGMRNSADALLILKYDVGLLQGDENFPPAPGKLYLARCDVVLDGKCNSSDALRILQCDIRLPGVSCDSATAAARAPDETAAPVLFRAEITPTVAADDGNAVVLTVQTGDPAAALAATSLRLAYDASAWRVAACTTNPSGRLNGGVCNSSEAGTVRFNSVAVQGMADATPLAQITFYPLGAAAAATLASQLTLTAEQAYDRQGVVLPWQSSINGPTPLVPTPTDVTPIDTPEPANTVDYQLYLPIIHQVQGTGQPYSLAAGYQHYLPLIQRAQSAERGQAFEQTPTVTPSPTLPPTVAAAPPTPENTPTVEATPVVIGATPTVTLTTIVATPTPTMAVAPTAVPTVTLTTATAMPTLVTVATPTPSAALPPTATPTVTLTPTPASIEPPPSPPTPLITPTLVDPTPSAALPPTTTPTVTLTLTPASSEPPPSPPTPLITPTPVDPAPSATM